MRSTYSKGDLPAESITVDGKTWRRREFDTDSYQWVRELAPSEYDWDPEEDDISLVGTDVPIRVVMLQYDGDKWHVEGAETAGPNYHRPGFTELISSEYAATFEEAGAAFETVEQFIKQLS